jgi:hypothetical protein
MSSYNILKIIGVFSSNYLSKWVAAQKGRIENAVSL